ncbi:aromatic amino acid DMT transporter YddG [Acinetobacter sp. CE-15]|uniref:aromatic amino acid DMT transporter YddG n=1 Tax=Acinetobacter sp. CE-15 TaxID=3425693 RepID=UPI003DA2CF74
MNSKKATLIGLTAIFLWSLIVALIKEVSNYFGPIGGAALIYSIASIFLLVSFGWTNLKDFPTKYLIGGSILFVSYEICLSLSIGYSINSKQAIEIGMVNYLWPTATIIFSIIFNKQKANFLIIPGVCLSILGICLVLGGDEGFSIKDILLNIKENPFSYGLALIGVFLWAAYCTLTAREANGKNGITLFFILVSIVLWVKFTLSGDVLLNFDFNSVIYLVLAAFAMGIGYGAWNVGIMHGNVTLLATASYFVPVFSAIVSALILSTNLTLSFWKGALIVCFGSLLCWIATKSKS